MEPFPSNEVILFNWNQLKKPFVLSYMHFQFMVKSCDKNIYHIVIHEGTYVSILSLIAWQALSSPQLVFVTRNLLAFNRRTRKL